MVQLRKVQKFLNKKGTNCGIFEISATKMVPSEKGTKKSQTKMIPFQRMMKIATKNGTISENDRS